MLQGPLLGVNPTRATRFGSPLVLSRVHWVWPELVVEVTHLTGTEDGLLRQVVYEGLREDMPARELAATETVTPGRNF
jgi:ATP-dependent DNA ligase